MRDITSFRVLVVKAALLLVLGIFSAAPLLAAHGDIRTLLLLAICVWSFCRAYYFCFYVLEKYVDRDFRFSGIASAVKFVATRRARN